MTDYRELCAELVERAPDARRMDGIQSWEALLARARAALAQPTPPAGQVGELVASPELIKALQTAQPGRVEPLPGDAQMTDPIRIALERLLSDIHALADESTGVAGLHHNGDIAPWSELLEDGPYSSWLGDAIGAARAALAEPAPPAEGEGEGEK